MRVRSPIDTTGSLTICWPGAMPADSDTYGPIMVWLPIRIQRSLKMAPGGKAIRLPSPKAPKRRARGWFGPMAPRSQTQLQPMSMALDATRRAHGGI